MIDKLSALAPKKLGEVIAPLVFQSHSRLSKIPQSAYPRSKRDGALKTGGQGRSCPRI